MLNRAVRRAVLFANTDDYCAFIKTLKDATLRFNMRLLAYVVMPNHWHLVVWPDADLQLSRFMHWLTLVHTKRWHAGRGTTGTGPLYQGRYKAVPVQSDQHLLTAIRYVERNPLRAGLVSLAQDWPWSSASARQREDLSLISDGPVGLPNDWLASLNEGRDGRDLDFVRQAVRRSTPIGNADWCSSAASAFGLNATPKSAGRPRRK